MTFSTTAQAVESYSVVTAAEVGVESFGQAVEVVEGATGVLAKFAWAVSQHRCFEREKEGLNAAVA